MLPLLSAFSAPSAFSAASSAPPPLLDASASFRYFSPPFPLFTFFIVNLFIVRFLIVLLFHCSLFHCSFCHCHNFPLFSIFVYRSDHFLAEVLSFSFRIPC